MSAIRADEMPLSARDGRFLVRVTNDEERSGAPITVILNLGHDDRASRRRQEITLTTRNPTANCS